MAWVLRYLSDVCYPPETKLKLYHWALSVFKETGDRRGITEILYRMGALSSYVGDYQEADNLLKQSLDMAKKIDRHEIVAHILVEMGYVGWALGAYATAERHCRESLTYYEAIGYRSQIAYAKRIIARLHMGNGDYTNAKRLLQESVEIYAETGPRGMQAITQSELAHIATEQGNLREAQRLAEASRDLLEKLGYRIGLIMAHNVLGKVAALRGNLPMAREFYHMALKTAKAFSKPSEALYTMAAIAKLLNTNGEKEWALELAFFVHYHPSCWDWTRADLIDLITEVKSSLPSKAITSAQLWGKDKDVNEVINAVFRNSQGSGREERKRI